MQHLSKAVILDLLPAYLSDEASDETRALVDAAAAQDPTIAKLIATTRSQQSELLRAQPSHDLEMQTVKRTRARLRRQMWTLALAVVFSLMPLAFADRAGQFSISYIPKQALLLWALAAALWFEYFLIGGRIQTREVANAWTRFRRGRK